MIKAGYDPVALITALNKFCGQSDSDFGMSHPLTSKRLAYIYEYIYQKYPAYLADNSYKNNIYYQNLLLTSRKDREKIKNNVVFFMFCNFITPSKYSGAVIELKRINIYC